MEDLLMAVVKERQWADIDCYAMSAARHFKGRRVMLVEGVTGEAVERLQGLGHEVLPVKAYMPGLHFQSSRFFVATEYLASHRGQFDNIVWTDACDVVFQRDPVRAVLESLGTFQIAAVKEGWAIKDQAINDVWIRRLGLSPAEYSSLREQEVLCSGTIAGKADAMLTLFNAMCARMRDEMQGADQGLFNWIVRTSPFCNITRIFEPEEGFATTLGIFLAPSDRAAWTIEPPFLWDGLAYTRPEREGGRLFAIQHQYNRRYGELDPSGTWRERVERRIRDAAV